jgi:hypothetical protein
MAGAPVDPERDEARRWLTEELAGSEYAVQESWVGRAVAWLLERIPDPDLPGRLPGWASWAALALVVVAVLAVLAFAARDRWRRAGLAEARPGGAVFDDERLTASAYRERARAALRAGDHETAVLDAFRAVAAGAAERTLLDAAPGRTAHEVAVALTQVFPGAAADLSLAADRFDAVRYGAHPATAEQGVQALALEERLSASRPVLEGASV